MGLMGGTREHDTGDITSEQVGFVVQGQWRERILPRHRT